MNYRILIFCVVLLSSCATTSVTTVPTPSPEPLAVVAMLPSVTATLTPTPTDRPTLTPMATPTERPSPTPLTQARGEPVRLEIAAIELARDLVAVGLDSQRIPIVPNHDVGWYNLSAELGAGENIVLWGHVLRFKSAPSIPAPFAQIKDLQLGDEVVLYDAVGSARRYVVSKQVWATPDQVEYILPQGREMVTLVSCIGDKVVAATGIELSHRLITIAEPVE